MSKNTSSTQKKTEIQGFKGIDRSHFLGGEYCEEIKNFRIDSSGALVKRYGREKVFSFDTPVAAALNYSINSPYMLYSDTLVATPPTLHAVYLSTGDRTTIASDLGRAGSKVDLALYKFNPYLFDGNDIRTLAPTGKYLISATGYAPLYGKEWDPSDGGEIYESPNLLNGNLRINYKVKQYSRSLYVGFQINHIARIEINGVPTSNYLSEGYSITGEFPENSSVDVWLTRSFSRGTLFGCRSACTVGGGYGERLVAYGNTDSNHELFCSAPVSDDECEASKRGFANSDSLYFPESLNFNIGGEKIFSVCSCGDSFVIFGERNAILAKPSGLACELYSISTSVGCLAPHASLAKNRSVFTFTRDGIYRLDVDLTNPYETTSKRISDPIGKDALLLTVSCRIFEDPARGELWFCSGEHCFIYNPDSEVFYDYTGIYATAMIPQNDFIYLFDSYSIWNFSSFRYSDESDGTTQNIEAVAVSRWIDFGDLTKEKKGLTIYPIYDTDQSFKIGVITDGGYEFEEEIQADRSPAPTQKKIRISRCRFRRAKIKISCNGNGRPKIYGFVLSAQQ